MASPPRFRAFRPEDFKEEVPEWAVDFFATLNETLGGLVGALTRSLTRSENFASGEKTGVVKTKAAAEYTWPIQVKHGLPYQPRHVVVSMLRRQDGEPIDSPWSFTWQTTQDGALLCWFQGLADSCDYEFRLLVE